MTQGITLHGAMFMYSLCLAAGASVSAGYWYNVIVGGVLGNNETEDATDER